MRIKIIKNQEGVTLLMAMIIMSTVVAVAIGVSVLIIDQYQFSANVDHAIIAFYAAETGLEKNLKLVKDYRNISATKLGDITTALDGDVGTIGNLGGWQLAADLSEDYMVSSLKMNEKITIDIFNPDNLAGGGGVESVKINWRDNCLAQRAVAGSGWLKLSYVSLTKTGEFDPAIDPDVNTTNPYESIYDCALSGNACGERINTKFSADNYYRLVITPLYCDIDYLKVTAYSNNAATAGVNISNRVSLKSTGTYATSQIALSASVPWILPSSGIFDFVLFSEETIEKK